MNLFKNVHKSWIPLLHSLAYKEPLVHFLESLSEISHQPKIENIFKVFEMPVKDIKLVILGQDPYPKPGDAIGTAFAVSKESKVPTVLKNIQEEIISSCIPKVKLGERIPITESLKPWQKAMMLEHTEWKTLKHWAEQGVFLLNAALTVETGQSGSHIKYWREFTEAVINYISVENPCLWMMWGNGAKSFCPIIKNPFIVKGYDRTTIEEIPIDEELNYILPGTHPLSKNLGEKGNFSNDGFYHANRILDKKQLIKINW